MLCPRPQCICLLYCLLHQPSSCNWHSLSTSLSLHIFHTFSGRPLPLRPFSVYSIACFVVIACSQQMSKSVPFSSELVQHFSMALCQLLCLVIFHQTTIKQFYNYCSLRLSLQHCGKSLLQSAKPTEQQTSNGLLRMMYSISDEQVKAPTISTTGSNPFWYGYWHVFLETTTIYFTNRRCSSSHPQTLSWDTS